MKRTLFFIWLFSGLLIAAECCARPVVGFITNGEGCNIDWRKELPEYDVADAGDKNFLLSQQLWNLDERLLNRRPDLCIVYSGLPEILLGQPLPRTLEAFRTICERLDAAGARPVILLTLPASGEHPYLNSRISRLNEALKAFAASRDYACFDPSAGLTDGPYLSAGYTADGLMLNEAGLARFAANVRDFLGGMLPSGETFPASVRSNLASEVIRRILAQSPAKVRIVLLGDSLTANGKDWNPRLGRRDVRNAGQGGYLTGQMLWMLDTCVVAARPEICFVLAGINDLFNDIPPATVFANQRQIVTRLIAGGVRPVVQSVLFVHDNAALNARIGALNARLREWCAANGIDWLDLNPALADANGLKREYTTDGTHLTEQGYAIWSGQLRHYLDNRNTNP